MTNGERTVFSVNGTGKTGQRHAEEWNWTTILYHIQKLTETGLKTWMLMPKTIKFIEENIGGKFHDIGHSNFFVFDLTPKARATKQR